MHRNNNCVSGQRLGMAPRRLLDGFAAQSNRASRLVVICTGLLVALVVLAARPLAAQSIPGAESRELRWPAASAPFDLKPVLQLPSRSENAALDYMTALLEFAPDMAVCFPEKEIADRLVIVQQRSLRLRDLLRNRFEDRESVTTAQIDSLLKEYDQGFRLLSEAQKKPQCVFATGLSFQAQLPHLPAARRAADVAVLRIERLVARGDLGEALVTMARILRLSRDLRPAGFQIAQRVSMSIDDAVMGRMLPRILASPRLTTDVCDALIRLVAAHLEHAGDVAEIGWKMEYVMVRTMFEDMRQRTGDFSLDGLRSAGVNPITTVDDYIGKLLFDDPRSDAARDYLKKLEAIDRDAYRQELTRLNDVFMALLSAERVPYRRLADRMVDLETGLRDDSALLGPLLPSTLAFAMETTRHTAMLEASLAVIAVRRFQLAYAEAQLPSLEAICRSAGLKRVPLDPYSGKSVRLTEIENRPVIYCVGSDGVDDQGLKDWELGRNPGDFLFPVPVP